MSYSKSDKKNIQKNLQEHLKEALEEKNQEKIEIIKNLQNEIEKYLVIKNVRQDKELSVFFQKDINMVLQEGSFNLIEMILIKELELLELGDFEAINMLNKLKNNAQNKIKELNKIAINFHEQQKQQQSQANSIKVEVTFAPKVQYKPIIPIDGFHVEKTLGGEYIQALDSDIKNMVGSEIINSKPEDLSKNIIDQIKNIRHGNDPIPENQNNNNSTSILKDKKKDWVDHIKEEEGKAQGNSGL